MRVRTMMKSPALQIGEHATIFAALELMSLHAVSGLAVVDDRGRLTGIISEGDLLRRVEIGSSDGAIHWWKMLFSTVTSANAFARVHGRQVVDVMTRHPITIDENISLADAAELFERHHVKRLPVMRYGELVGIFSRSDLTNALRMLMAGTSKGSERSDDEIKQKIEDRLSQQGWTRGCSIEIYAENGIVVLSGTVASESHRSAAIALAEEAVANGRVQDSLEVASPFLKVF